MMSARSLTVPALIISLIMQAASYSSTARAEVKCGDAACAWTPVEEQAWKGIISDGRKASFAKDKGAILRGKFIKDVLTIKSLSELVPVEGLSIENATITDLVLDNIEVGKILKLMGCRFIRADPAITSFKGHGAVLFYVRTKQLIDLSFSEFPQGLNLSGLSTESTLNLAGINAAWVALDNAKIAENINVMKSARIQGQMTGNGLQVSRDLVIINSNVGAVTLRDARIDGNVNISNSRFVSIVFDKARIGRVVLEDVQSLRAETAPSVSLDGARIDRDLEIKRGSFSSIRGINLSVGGRLSAFGSKDLPLWQGAKELNLHNSSLTVLTLQANATPNFLDIIGVAYKSFDLLEADGDNAIPNVGKYLVWLSLRPKPPQESPLASDSVPTDNKSSSYQPPALALLNRDMHAPRPHLKLVQVAGVAAQVDAVGKNPPSLVVRLWEWIADTLLSRGDAHSPQPYLELAKYLKVAGFDHEADLVRIAEREAARKQASWISWPWETLKYGLIGYGYRKSLAFVWIGFFLVVGWIVVRRSRIAGKHGFGFTYSFDMLLPIVRLREAHYKTELELPYRAYFYFHRIVGYLLGLFLLAALSGLTNVS